MSTIRPRTRCKIRRRTEEYDVNGRAQHTASTRNTKCAVVWLRDKTDETSVRADSSASRGRADESVYQARLLFHPREDLATGDLVEILQPGADSITIEISSIHRRPDVNGQIHHVQVEGDRWVSA